MRRIINQYNQCRLKTVKPGKQLMAELPDSRLQLGFPPFAHVRVDYFGPLMVHQRRSELKPYGCLFTCTTMKAVHLEVTRDLSTDTLINAIRCFVAHRGPVQHTYSDNGTNLVDAERVLRQAIPGIRTRFTNIVGRATPMELQRADRKPNGRSVGANDSQHSTCSVIPHQRPCSHR